MKFRFILIVMIITIAIINSGCSLSKTDKPVSESYPEETVEKFIGGCSDCDAEAVLECINPNISKGAKAALSLLSKAVDVDIEDILNVLPMLKEMLGNYSYDLTELNLVSAETVYLDDGSAEVHAEVEALKSDGQTSDGTVKGVFKLEKTDDIWYIVAISGE